MKENISSGLKRYYSSIEYKNLRKIKDENTIKNVLKLLSEEQQTTLQILNKYNQVHNKDVTLRRMRQLLYLVLKQRLVETKIVNTSKKGRSRVWSLKQKNSSAME